MKTLKISDELHFDIKKYCNDNGLKLNNWVGRQLELKLKECLYVTIKENKNNR